MPNLVTSGATLACTLGTATSLFQVPAVGGITAGGVPVATIADHKAMVNIRPFGVCTSPTNPGGGANRPPPPCVPAIVTPWMPGSPSVRTGNVPVLNDTGQCRCQWGGVVSILAPGQQTTTVS